MPHIENSNTIVYPSHLFWGLNEHFLFAFHGLRIRVILCKFLEIIRVV